MNELALTAGALAVLGASAAWFDFRERRLPNWLCALVFVVGLVLSAESGGFAGLGWHALHAAVALLAGMALFAWRIIGGGDAKYYAAVAAWFPIDAGLRLLVCVAIAGGLVLVCWAVARKLAGKVVFAKNAAEDDKLPYGIAISLGGIWATGAVSVLLN